MATKQWINKKSAQNYALVHRSHEDPLFFNEDASDRVLVPIKKDNKKKRERLETKEDLQKQLDEQIKSQEIRANEGQAADYGITFDDTSYDYMMHLKPIGNDHNGVFIPLENQSKPIKKDQVLFKDDKNFELPQDVLPSKETIAYDYQRQQNIPDAIKGFQPNLAPDLIEALEALEDEAYIDGDYDEDDINVFGQLLTGGKQKELKLHEYDGDDYVDNDADEWDMDNYDDEYADYDSGDENNNGKQDGFNWEKDFGKFKKAQSRGKINNDWDSEDDFDSEDEEDDNFGELPDLDSAHLKSKSSKKKSKRKKGALTDTSSYSMSSSIMNRTEQMTIIDDRFDVMKEKYEIEEEDDYEPFDFKNERSDFEGLVDDFLDNYKLEKGGRRIVKKNDEAEKIQRAVDSVSKSKLAARRRLEEQKKKDKTSSFSGLTQSMGKMSI